MGPVPASRSLERILSDLRDHGKTIDGDTRAFAADCLSAWAAGGRRAEAAAGIPALLGTLRDEYDRVRRSAYQALGRIGLSDPRHVAAVAPGVFDPDDRVRPAAIEALRRSGPAVRPAIPVLVGRLEAERTPDPSADSRRNVLAIAWGVQALGKLGPYSWEARPVLVRLLDGSYPRGNVTSCAEKAIIAIVRTLPDDGTAGPADDAPLPVLCALEPGVRDEMRTPFVVFRGVVEICAEAGRPLSLETLRVQLAERGLVEVSAGTIRNHVAKVEKLLHSRFGIGNTFERVQGRPFRLLPPAQKAHQLVTEYLQWEPTRRGR